MFHLLRFADPLLFSYFVKKMDRKSDNEEKKAKVCAPCGKKIVFGKKKSDFFRMTEKYERLVKMFTNEDFKVSEN